jgi:transposase
MKELRELRKELEAVVESDGQASVDSLFDLLEKQVGRCDRLEKENTRLRLRIIELEQKINPPAPNQPAPTKAYSLDSEERRRRKQRRRKADSKRKPGRKPKKDKLDCVRWVDILPDGVRKKDCDDCNERPVWHIENGQAVRVGYRVHRQSWKETPRIPGVLPRCEYAIEIHVLLAHLVYITGISIGKACQLLQFFCSLPIERSQADAMLNQLGKQWGDEFDSICEQLVLASVVYSDETSWKIGRLNSSLWSFTSELHCVMLFGCSKDRETLESILPPETFSGVLVSDDAAVYREGYRGQKCWAHLIRKAIKLRVDEPGNLLYQRFLDDILELFGDAKRIASDGRLGDRGRADRVSELESWLCDICHPHWPNITPGLAEPSSTNETSFRNLVNEWMRLLTAEHLFEFVLSPEVDPTNNLSERQLRSAALARKAKRTNKTDTGATRQTHIVSVLESLRRTLDDFTIQNVVAKVTASFQSGARMFQATGEP